MGKARTFAVDLEVDDDGLHCALAVPAQALARPPAHLPHQELAHAAGHGRRPQELVLRRGTSGEREERRDRDGKERERAREGEGERERGEREPE